MSTDLFGPSQAVGIPSDVPVRLVIENLEDERLWLTSIRGDIEPNYQLMTSLGAEIFINAFHDKLSVFQISGIYVFNLCGTEEGGGEPAFMTFYRRNNIAVATEPIRITFNGIVVTGYLIKLALGDFNQQDIEGHSFTLTFLGLLDSSLSGRTGFKQSVTQAPSSTGAAPAATFTGVGFTGLVI